MNKNQHNQILASTNWTKTPTTLKLLMGKTFFAFAFLLFSFAANAQSISVSYNSTAQPDGAFTVCSTAETNSLKITNGNGFALTNPSFTLKIPTGGTYVAGSITGATESNITNLNAPVFTMPTLAASNNATITYQISFGCGVIAYQSGGGLTKETVDFTYTGGSGSQTNVTPTSTYNVKAAALSITSATNTSYTGNVGSSFTQTLNIVNGGLGCTNTAFILLDGQNGSYSFSSPSAGTISHDTLFLATTDMPGTDGMWCNGETKAVTYTVTINNCNNLNRSTKIAWGCNTTNCQPSSTAQNSNIIISNSTPNLITSLPTVNRDWCMRGDLVKQTIRIVNTGAGPATNVQFTARDYVPGSHGAQNRLDTTTNWDVKDKNGNIIGTVNHFTNGTVFAYANSTCGFSNGYSIITGTLTGITILPNDTIYVDVYSRMNNFSCDNNCYTGLMMYSISTQLDYKNQCGTGTYQYPFVNHFNSGWGPYYAGTASFPTDVSGILPNNTFNIDIFYTWFSNVGNHPSGKGKTMLIMPLTGTDMLPTVSSISYQGLILPVNVINDTMFIGPVPQLTSKVGNLRIPMQATCGTGGTKAVSIYTANQYDSTCSPIIKTGCFNGSIIVHCTTPCPKGGATPELFTLKRINYGSVDNNNDGIPDASGIIDLNKIEDHHSVNGDTLQGYWKIVINPNNEPTDAHFGQAFTNTYIDFELGTGGLGQPGTLTALPNAQVTIYPLGGAAYNCTVTPTIVGTKAHYDFASCRSPWVNGDSMIVKALFTVNQLNCYRYNGAKSAGSTNFVTNIEVYSTYSPQTTPTTAPIANTTYTCDHYNDYNQISRIWLDAYIPQGQIITGCSNTLVSYMRYYTRGQEGRNIFPYEYRNFFIPDTMKVQIPHGFVYRSNTAHIYQDNSSALNASIANANVYQVADTLFFINLKNFYTPYGGTFTAGDETEQIRITYSVDATCNAVSGLYDGRTSTVGLGNGLNTPTTGYGDNQGWTPNATGAYPTYTYKAPQAVLAGGGTVVTNTGSASWTMQLQNLANDAPAANAYFYISPLNSFTNIVIKEGATTITPDANGFYQLGDLLASANRNFTIIADLGRCSLDSFRIYFGNSCTGSYPTTFTASSCQQQAWFKASGYPAALDVTFDRVPSSGTVGLCTPFTLEAVINSNLVGNLDNEVYKVILPPHVSYVNNSVQVLYPVGSSYAANAYNPTVKPAATGDTLVFAVNSVASTPTGGLTGVGDLVHNQVKIKFDAQTTCGYISGSSTKAIITGTSVCGDPTATVVKTTSAINITGAVASTQYVITELGPASFSTCGANGTITVTVKNTGTGNPLAIDSFSINLSAGLSYVAGSFTSIKNPPSTTTPVINGNTLRWQIPSTVVPGDSMKFTINLAASSAGCGQNTLDLYATQSIVLSCGGSPCSTPVITGRLISDTITTICCVDMQVNKTVSPNPVAAGANAVYTVAVYNAGPGTATNVVVNDVLPAGVTYVSNTRTSGTYTAPDWTIPSMAAGQRDTIKFTVTANNSTTSPIIVANKAYIKSIDATTPETNRTNDTSSVNLTINPNCTGVSAGADQAACGNTSVTITGTPTTGTWSALGTNPTGATLGSTSAGVATANFATSASGIYKFILTDGSCTDTMQVSVKAATSSTTNLAICANQIPYTWNGLTFNAAGTQTAHLTNAAGCDSAATLVLTVNALPNAGSNQTVTCNVTGTATMNAVGTGIWSAVSGNPGTATITTPSSPTTTITGFSAAGTYSFKWTNAAGCSSTVTITVGNACCRAGNTAPVLKP